MKRETPKTNKIVSKLTSVPLRRQRVKERVSGELENSNLSEADWSSSFTVLFTIVIIFIN